MPANPILCRGHYISPLSRSHLILGGLSANAITLCGGFTIISKDTLTLSLWQEHERRMCYCLLGDF